MPPGPPQKLTVDESVSIIRDAERPVWTVQQFADRADVSHPTARERLSEAVDRGDITTMDVAGCTVYYLPGKEMERFDDGEHSVAGGLRTYWEGRFVGDRREPSILPTMHGAELSAGDRGKFQAIGWPGDWEIIEAVAYDESLGSKIAPPAPEGYTGIITGELEARPTVPIEHTAYPDDYDLELNIGARDSEIEGHPAVIATGVKSHLIRPCNDALFLRNVVVENLDGPAPKDVTTVDVKERSRDPYLPTELLKNND